MPSGSRRRGGLETAPGSAAGARAAPLPGRSSDAVTGASEHGPTFRGAYAALRIGSRGAECENAPMAPGVRTCEGARARWAVFALLWFSACASYRGGELSERRLEDLERDGRLPAVTYSVSEAGSVQFLTGVQNLPAPSIVFSRVEPLFRRLFVEAKRQEAPGPVHLDMYFRSAPHNPSVTVGLGLCFIVTLGLFPAYAQDDLYLEVRLRRNGEAVRQYVYEESVHTWMHWFLLPWSFTKDPETVTGRAIDQLLLNLVFDLRRERELLEPPR
jgi:hypothetical protein